MKLVIARTIGAWGADGMLGYFDKIAKGKSLILDVRIGRVRESPAVKGLTRVEYSLIFWIRAVKSLRILDRPPTIVAT